MWFVIPHMSTQDDAMMQVEDVVTTPKDVTVSLNALSDSGEQGTAVLSDVDGKTKVTVLISGAPTTAQPMHIHTGSCPTPGAVTYPLTSLTNGSSETVLDVPLATIMSQLPLAINVHQSATELKTFVSCGDITPAEGAMMKEETAMNDVRDDSMMASESGAMMTKGVYEVYSPERVATAGNNTVLLFFHADWCPTCRALDADINAHLSAIPEGVMILKVDYDKETALKQKYGVTVQHTIVEVDSKSLMGKKWVVATPTFSSLIAELK